MEKYQTKNREVQIKGGYMKIANVGPNRISAVSSFGPGPGPRTDGHRSFGPGPRPRTDGPQIWPNPQQFLKTHQMFPGSPKDLK